MGDPRQGRGTTGIHVMRVINKGPYNV